MSVQRNQNWLIIALIAGALLGWMGILAMGAYRAQIGDASGGDPRKLLVVAATTGGFLLMWGLVLLRFWMKPRRQAENAVKMDTANPLVAKSTESADKSGES